MTSYDRWLEAPYQIDAMGEYEDARGEQRRREIRDRLAGAVSEALAAADKLRVTATRWADRA